MKQNYNLFLNLRGENIKTYKRKKVVLSFYISILFFLKKLSGCRDGFNNSPSQRDVGK